MWSPGWNTLWTMERFSSLLSHIIIPMRVGLIFLLLVTTITCSQYPVPNDDSMHHIIKRSMKHDMGHGDLSTAVSDNGQNIDSDPSMSSKDPETSQRKSLPPPHSEDTATNITADSTDHEAVSSVPASVPSDDMADETGPKERGQEGGVSSCHPTPTSITDTLEPVTTSESIMQISEPVHHCANHTSPWPPCKQDPTTNLSSTEFLANSLTKVSLNLFQNIMAKDRNANVVFSPFSLILLLSHLLLGARGITKERLQEVLFHPPNSNCVHTAVNQLSKSKGFVAASAIFHHQDLIFNEFFVNESKEFYDSTPQTLTQEADQNLQLINNWVANKTHNKIKKLLEEVPGDIQLMLLNAVSLRAKWITKFKMENTRKEKFQKLDKSTVKVAMMNSDKYPLISFSDRVLGARIGRFGLTHNMSLVIMLPQGPQQTLSNMEKQLDDEIFQQVMNRLYKDPVRPAMVSMPKIKVDTTLELLELLDKIGLSELFYSPNFCGMSAEAELAVSSGTHRSLVEVNEEGVEAAGVSAISFARTFHTFEVRQPFLFFLLNDKPRVTVFMGRVTNPAA
ncbi:plasma protease C1 inhibitor isoform X2 [Rhinatrema bivittatum]|uniref:plasma protease C1 inhibitor isoform X2 n=2 Tax=Rhinatrema bivittatum TaxID=194408 RepID=UPI00112A7DDB|nr:plasma protease C1 inhibitor isoform X2 [Rhinatrema bivittatum]